MTEKAITNTVLVLTAIIGVAIVALLVSKNANTANVLTASGSGFSKILNCAVSPITGNTSDCAGNGMIESVTSSFNPL